MPDWIQRQSALATRCVVAELGGRPCVAELVDGYADYQGNGEGGKAYQRSDRIDLKLIK